MEAIDQAGVVLDNRTVAGIFVFIMGLPMNATFAIIKYIQIVSKTE